jgi:hypothetical protein
MKTTLEQNKGQQIPPTLSPLARLRAGRNDKGNGKADFWGRAFSTIGAAVWAGLAVLTRMGIARIGAIDLMFLFAPLVIVPLGMELGRVVGGSGRLEAMARQLQPVGAACAIAAMWMPPGRKAGLVALGWLVVCLLMAGAGVMDLVSAAWSNAGKSPFDYRSGRVRATRTHFTLVGVTLAIARIDLAVGGAWLVASRLGLRPMGIQEPIGLLTAVHFHFAGFATATIAAATLRFAEGSGQRRWLKGLVVMVIGMPYVVAAGFVISPALKMGAALLFSVSVAGLAVFLHSCGRQMEVPTARRFLQIASGAVFAGMVLSASYAVADFAGSDLLTIPQMARTHGVLNAVGFCLPGLLGWLVEEGRH